MSIIIFSFENDIGEEASAHITQDRDEALAYGQAYGLRVIANEYVWDDSELVADFTQADEPEDKKARAKAHRASGG